jgi:hypothetical protein
LIADSVFVSFSGLSIFDCWFSLCQFLWIVHFWLLIRSLPVSLDCPFLIVDSVFSNVYLANIYWTKQNKIWAWK